VVKHLFAEGAYDRAMLMDKAAFLSFSVEVIRRLVGVERLQGSAKTQRSSHR